MGIEWQAHGRSNTAHMMDTERSTRLSKRSGPRSACGRYPGRRYKPWWALGVEEMLGKPLPSGIERCSDCAGIERRLWSADVAYGLYRAGRITRDQWSAIMHAELTDRTAEIPPIPPMPRTVRRGDPR